MSDRPRPYTPYEVRCRVALRQIGWTAQGIDNLLSLHRPCHRADLKGSTGYKRLLKNILPELAEKLECTVAELRLDHNPALILRPYNPRIKNIAARYTPNANDPDALIYRSVHDHHIKTNVHGDGAQRSDTSQRVYLRKVEKNKVKREGRRRRPVKAKRPSRPIPQRRNAWPPKGSRPFRSKL